MLKMSNPYKVAIIDFGLGNLFSIKNACEQVDLKAVITSDHKMISQSQAIILPGVGAFGTAIERLRSLGLIDLLKEQVAIGKPLIGICLGMQLLMSESYEFGKHKGLDFIKGEVIKLACPALPDGRILKIPHVGWNKIYKNTQSAVSWQDSFLSTVKNNSDFYFVHSYHVKLADPSACLSWTEYEGIKFCSALQYKNIFAVQFHPERSGFNGLEIYRNIQTFLEKNKGVKEYA